MNILFLSELFYPHFGGAELATYLYAKHLANNDINVRVVTNRFPGDKRITYQKNLVIYRLDLFKGKESTKFSILSRLDILLSNYLKKMIKWSDIVYIPRLWFSSIPLIKSLKKPVIVHLHDYIPICSLSNVYDMTKNDVCTNFRCSSRCIWSWERKTGRSLNNSLISLGLNVIIWPYIGQLVKLSDAIICVSNEHKRIIVEKEPSLYKKTHVIYNPLPELKQIELVGNDFGYFGGSNPLKGFPILYDAMNEINRTSLSPIKVHATKVDDTRYSYETLNKIGIIPYGRLSENQFTNMYKNVQTVIVPSVWPEPLPYVVVEALSRGRLVIASKIGGIPEEVKGCKGVFLCEPGNHIQLSEVIKSVNNMPSEMINDMAQHNEEVFLHRFNDEDIINKFISLCQKLVFRNI